MKATIATGEFEAVFVDGSPVMWVTRVKRGVPPVSANSSGNYEPARGILNAVFLGSALWLCLGAAVWFLI